MQALNLDQKTDKTRKYLLEEIKQNESIRKHKKACRNLNYVKHLHILASTVLFEFLFLYLLH